MHHIGRIGDLSPRPSTPDWRRKVSDGGIHRMVEVPACWYHSRDRCECIFTMDHGWPTSASAGEILTHNKERRKIKGRVDSGRSVVDGGERNGIGHLN